MIHSRHHTGLHHQEASGQSDQLVSSKGKTKSSSDHSSKCSFFRSDLLDSRWAFLSMVLLFALLATISSYSAPIAATITESIAYFASLPKSYEQYIFVGSFTKQVSGIKVAASMEGKGITTFGINPETGQLEQVGTSIMVGENPSYLIVHPFKNVVYALNELGLEAPGKVYSIDVHSPESAQVKNFQESPGYNPSSISVDPKGEFLVVSFFLSGGGIAVYSLEEDGAIGPLQDFRQWSDSSMVHFASFDLVDGSHILALDIGLGLVKSFALDRGTGKLAEVTTLELPAEYGPRYLAWGPTSLEDGPAQADATKLLSVYLSLQQANGVVRLEYDHSTGRLSMKEDQFYSDCEGTADIRVLNDRLFLACRKINGKTGGVKVQKLKEDGVISSTGALTLLTDGFSTRNIAVKSFSSDEDEVVQVFLSNELSDDLTSIFVETSSLKLFRNKEPSITKLESPEGVAILTLKNQ